ncbi:MAG: serine/threonine-protein kinase [Acidimicrobiales bacterium]
MANPRMTAEIGRVLGRRYRLVAPIGMGASAQVYLADDVKLRRRVAVKMLHDALAGDAEFLRRFRAEARAAAALSHPNIMAVYDWSDGAEDGEAAFIVTEYLAGGSLRSLLDGGALLAPSQALLVGLEAARALDYAHRRGFVHRDIKPANLLFGDDQRLRIADFGLARALAEAAWTEPQGAVLGTARYASPEQAKGETLSGKADVYSLGLVIIEAVTGEVPFVADTTLGTLMARVDKEVPVPEGLGALREVLVGAGHPDPEQRIDARALATGLLRAARELSRPAPLPLVGALAAGAGLASDLDPTVHAPLPGQVAQDPEVHLTDEDLDLDPPHWVSGAEPAALAVGAAAGMGVIDVTDPPAALGAADVPEVVDLPDEPGEIDLTDPGAAPDGGPVAGAGADLDASTEGADDGAEPFEEEPARAWVPFDQDDDGADSTEVGATGVAMAGAGAGAGAVGAAAARRRRCWLGSRPPTRSPRCPWATTGGRGTRTLATKATGAAAGPGCCSCWCWSPPSPGARWPCSARPTTPRASCPSPAWRGAPRSRLARSPTPRAGRCGSPGSAGTGPPRARSWPRRPRPARGSNVVGP